MLRSTLSFILAFVFAGPAVAAPAAPEAVGTELDRAMRAGDVAGVQGLIADDFRHAVPVAGVEVAAALARTRTGFAVAGVRKATDRAVLTGTADARPIVLLLERRADGWRIAGVGGADDGAAFLAGRTALPRRHPALLKVGEALGKALASSDADAAMKLMSPAFLAAQRDGGRDLIAQFVRKGLVLAPLDAHGAGGVGALVADVEVDGRPVDRVWLLASRGERGWLFEAVTEDERRVEATLDGRIGPRFDPRALPGDDGARAAVEGLGAALTAGEGDRAVAALGPEAAQTPGIGQPRARGWLRTTAARKPAVKVAAVHADVQRGRAVARVEVAAGEDRRPSTVWVYIARADARWVVVDLNFGLTARWFFTR